MTYSTAFKNIDSRTVAATKQLVKSGLWKKDVDNLKKVEICGIWLKTVSEIYNVEVPEFVFDTSEIMYRQTGGGCYNPSRKRIELFKKFSLATLLHEFRHHIQHEKEIKLYKNDIEEDARAWSISLFATALPRSYKSAADRGILHFK